MLENFNKILVLAPHTDDGEFGCGATIARLIEYGKEVYYVAFSSCEISVPDGFPKDILVQEVKAATSILGIKPENLFILNYDVRTFSYHRQEILDDILKFKKLINPDAILIPSLNDIHQDHATIALEALRAFKFSTILSYELCWNNIIFNTNLLMNVEERHLLKKIEAIKAYKSQGHRTYINEDFLCSQAIVRGVQANCKFAEAFEVIRINIK